jgi:hypothetical protein
MAKHLMMQQLITPNVLTTWTISIQQSIFLRYLWIYGRKKMCKGFTMIGKRMEMDLMVLMIQSMAKQPI